jgi:hypothetical protein
LRLKDAPKVSIVPMKLCEGRAVEGCAVDEAWLCGGMPGGPKERIMMDLAGLAMSSSAGDFASSPFIVPVAGCAMVLGIVMAGVWSSVRNREIQSRERLEAIARGVPIPPTPEELAITHGRPTANLARRRANLRLTGVVLLATAVGMILFFVTLSAVLHVREVLSGAAVALVPLAMGVGFLIDTRLQTREMEQMSSGHGVGELPAR